MAKLDGEKFLDKLYQDLYMSDLEAVKQNMLALKYASNKLQNDAEIISIFESSLNKKKNKTRLFKKRVLLYKK